MVDPLSAESLMAHIRALAADIGPRPTGQPPEEQARAYIRRALADYVLRFTFYSREISWS